MKVLNFFALLLVTSFSFAQVGGNKIAENYSVSPTGIRYVLYKDIAGPNVKVGNIVVFQLIIKTENDSLLRNTYLEGAPAEMFVQASPFKGSLQEAMTFLSKGDSALFLISADSLFEKSVKQPMPPYIKKGSFLKFVLVPLKVSTREELMKEQMEAAAQQRAKDSVLIEDYIKGNKLKAVRYPSGLRFVKTNKVKKDAVTPKAGQTVVVHYTGKLLNGNKFDSSVDRNQPFEFVLGQGQVIQGWDEGLAKMKVGEKGILIIPSGLGYGQQAAGTIPPNSVLVFEVELINVK